jgi:non-ribosomal peptide synthetase component F
VILPEEAVRDPELLVEELAREHVTRIVLVPSLLRALLEYAPNLEARLPQLKLWTCSGEILPVELARKFREAMPEAKLLNIYGSSEVGADATWHEVEERDLVACSVAIGRPISNTQIYLLDEHGQPVPAGVRGEIYVGGEGLARGYLNRAELTAERFVANEVAPEQSARLYRTGDVGRYRSNGEVEYVGRVDQQVKLRGQRIELGEVETVLGRHESVRQAVVAVTGAGEQQKLSAYLVLKEGAEVPKAGELRQQLRAKLPEAMVPTSYWRIERVPLLASGKVNRGELGQAGGVRLGEEQEPVEARNEVEAKLAEIWRELLKVEQVGMEENFFELGGHSLLVLQVTARIRRVLEVELPVRSLFEAPTIAGLAIEVEKARALGLKPRTPILQTRSHSSAGISREALMAQLDNLSSSELQGLLQRVLDGKSTA